MNISEDLKQKAIKLNLCKEWTDGWQNPDLDSLCEMFVTGIDFCIKNNYPSTEYIKANFGDIAENHGIYTDTEICLENPDVAILLGKTKGDITLYGYVSRDIYVRHDCEVNITVKDSAKAFIRVFNSAKVTIDNQSTSRIFVYKYTDGFNGKIYTSGDVMVREKTFKDL